MAKHADLVCVSATQIPGVRKLLLAWTDAVLRYCEMHGFQDNPWWFNERATLSTLAGAAWNLGWVAVEEFTTEKRKRAPDGVEEGDVQNGRCDLYIRAKSRDYAVEAKQAWQRVGSRATGCRTAVAAMDKAWEDASKLQAGEGDFRLAVTFVVPSVARAEAKKGVRPTIERWLKERPLRGLHTKRQAYAHVFPGRFGEFQNEDTGYCYPGVAVVVEQRQHGFKNHKHT